MKKSILLFIVVSICFCFTACKSEEAKNVDKLISSIGEVTLDSEKDIIAAENAFKALTDEHKEQVDLSSELEAARTKYGELVEADKIIKAIKEIKTVTLESNEVISNARKLFDKSSENVKALVDNYSILEKAETTFSKLRVDRVNELITKIGEVTLDDEAIIREAYIAFENFSEEEIAQVKDADFLISSFEKLESLQKAAKEKAAKEALGKMNAKVDDIAGTTWYKHKNFPVYRNSRDYALPLILHLNGSNANVLKIQASFSDDSWIFFEELIYSIDGKNYYESFNYHDVIRETYLGGVNEVVEYVADIDDIEMLRKIVDSNKTVVRFAGDTYHHDLTLTATDKQIIKETLAAFDGLNNK